MRWIALRNKVIGDPQFQRWSARIPVIRWLARTRARQIFALSTGFTTTATLLAYVESGLLEALRSGPMNLDNVSETASLSSEAAIRLLRAGEALDITQEVGTGVWMLGEQGAALASNAGAQAMIRHHRILYRDLLEPLELLRKDRREPTQLSRYWTYVERDTAGEDALTKAAEYSKLMAVSQHFVAEQVLDSFGFHGVKKLLDVGGGSGAFAREIKSAHPDIDTALFDLPEVTSSAPDDGITRYSGDFFRDPIPQGFDMITLSRILHDHDDKPALALLRNIRASLTSGDRLLIAEPMAGVAGARAMGDVYFGLYLWAMNSGRPRRESEIKQMLSEAGFARAKSIPTPQPLVTSIIVAVA